MKKILIIGAGWYGCHLGLYLKEKGFNVSIYEKEKDIFMGSSGRNQFRLHQGYHYPRSSITIKEAKKNFLKFKKKYGSFVTLPKNNIYCIAKKESLIDFGTYLNVLKSNNLFFSKKKFGFLQNIEGSVLAREGVILNSKIKNFYKKILKKEIKFGKKIKSLNKLSKNFNYLIDCTNNTFRNNFSNEIRYILTISFIYKKRKGFKVYPVTIMDGKLPSIYPYSDKKDFFTLTHSEYTHIKSFKTFKGMEKFKKNISEKLIENYKNLSEKSIKNFYSEFKKCLIYKGYFLSYKIIPYGKTDVRPTFYKREKKFLSIFSPKIGNIFTAEKIVKEFINAKN